MKTASALQHDVLQELEWEPSIDAAEIGVAVDDGIVTLTGEVHSYQEKLTAERVAKRVGGVRGVANDILVRLPSDRTHTDTDLARVAANSLEWSVNVPQTVKVSVKDGWITLDGVVDAYFQKDAATRAVKHLLGVKGVTNLIQVRPRIVPGDVKAKIVAALRRNAAIDAEHITVTVDGSTITLRGAVRSWAEREDAENAAWSAPGVTKVLNDVTIQSGIAAALPL